MQSHEPKTTAVEQSGAAQCSTSYPRPICQGCGKECDIWQEVETDHIGKTLEVWNYCPNCNLETFHPISE